MPNFIVFRDTAEQVSAVNLFRRLVEKIDYVKSASEPCGMTGLILAGQLECALADSEAPCAREAESLTDALAAACLGIPGTWHETLSRTLSTIDSSLPNVVRVSPPEGFAYYALHPADFSDAALAHHSSGPAAVIGIRSIGTTLSAITSTALSNAGYPARRMTVRPNGHPFAREMKFNDSQRSWIEDQKQRDASFLIVDEGPGLSGSSFLAVAESLVGCGIASERITLLCTREPEPASLCANDAARRWAKFKCVKVPSRLCSRFRDHLNISGGKWRNLLLGETGEWPSCWPEMERLKFLSPNQQILLKFDGLGEFGERVRERIRVCASAGYSPPVEHGEEGMTRSQFIPGTPLSRSDLSRELLDRIASYCAFRASAFAETNSRENRLEPMLRFNFSQEVGREPRVNDDAFITTKPVITDARMQPHEWIRTQECILKNDAGSHGEDHFLPGPTDIAWDLAGTVVEWNLDGDGKEYFLERFRRLSEDDPRARINAFVLAYSTFRMAYCKMALEATQQADEKARLSSAYAFYRQTMLRCDQNGP